MSREDRTIDQFGLDGGQVLQSDIHLGISDHVGETGAGGPDEVGHVETQHHVVAAATRIDLFEEEDPSINEDRHGLPMGEGWGATDRKAGDCFDLRLRGEARFAPAECLEELWGLYPRDAPDDHQIGRPIDEEEERFDHLLRLHAESGRGGLNGRGGVTRPDQLAGHPPLEHPGSHPLRPAGIVHG